MDRAGASGWRGPSWARGRRKTAMQGAGVDAGVDGGAPAGPPALPRPMRQQRSAEPPPVAQVGQPRLAHPMTQAPSPEAPPREAPPREAPPREAPPRAGPAEPCLQEGPIEPWVRSELPGLRIVFAVLAASPRPSPPGLVARLRVLSDRFRGPSIVALRTQPVPHAYRALYRQIGLDPDTDRIPVEDAAVRRVAQGHFSSLGLIEDALLIALVETGVPVWALDADRVSGPLGIRTSTEPERVGVGERAAVLPQGRLCVADGRCVHAPLFAAPAQSSRPSASTRSLTLFSVGAPGVPAIHTEEAIWQAAEALACGG